MMSLAAAVIHFAVTGEHFQEYWLYGVFMLVVAWLQLLWVAGAIARPSRSLLAGGAVLNAGVVAVYIVTRTAGDVIGPGAGSAEQAGFGDVLCTVLEAVVAAVCAWLLLARTERRIAGSRLLIVPGAVAAVTASAAKSREWPAAARARSHPCWCASTDRADTPRAASS